MDECPASGCPVTTNNLHAQRRHMEDEHPEIIAQRLQDAGMGRERDNMFGRTKTEDMKHLQSLRRANLIVSFDTPGEMRDAAMTLMTCHPHHFAVLADNNNSLAISKGAAKCLNR